MVCVQDEVFHIGGRGEHNTGLPEEERQAICRSIADNLVLPLHSKGYQILLFGDVVADDHRLHEVEEAFRQCLPPDTIMEIRVKRCLSGLNQIGSVITCLDSLYHFLRMRKKTSAVLGAYIVRTDVELLRNDLSGWPTDKLCFPWNTSYDGLQNPVNDVLFYIPQFLFNDVRTALASPDASVSRKYQNLHWLGDVVALREHIWLQYNFFHPANTERMTNPLYRIRGRETGIDSTGKFVQYDLDQQEETEAKIAAGELSPSVRREVWSSRVRHIALLEAAEGRDLEVHAFVNRWSHLYPDDAVKWFQPDIKILRSLVMVEDIQRMTDSRVRLVTKRKTSY